MNKLLPTIPLAAFLATSCQQSKPTVQTLPPVVKKAPTVAAKPKKRSYRTSTSPSPSPSSSSTVTTATATTLSTEPTADPLVADPLAVVPVSEIPSFDVPLNVQPKVADGINQGIFIELKW